VVRKKRKKQMVPRTNEYWNILKEDAIRTSIKEPLIEPILYEGVSKHSSFKDALFYRLATKLGGKLMNVDSWLKIFTAAYEISLKSNIDLETFAMCDLVAIKERDPACDSLLTAFIYFKGYKALQIYRVANILWYNSRTELALLLQSRCSEIFGVDIHPAAIIGIGVMIDHATGLVIGATARVGDNCSFLHNVTLGATGKEFGDRHPKLGNNVSVGCNASILGNISVGDNSKIGSGSIILKNVASDVTAVGNPVRIIPHKKIEIIKEKNEISENINNNNEEKNKNNKDNKINEEYIIKNDGINSNNKDIENKRNIESNLDDNKNNSSIKLNINTENLKTNRTTLLEKIKNNECNFFLIDIIYDFLIQLFKLFYNNCLKKSTNKNNCCIKKDTVNCEKNSYCQDINPNVIKKIDSNINYNI
jgi:serine O-acetyltransferase